MKVDIALVWTTSLMVILATALWADAQEIEIYPPVNPNHPPHEKILIGVSLSRLTNAGRDIQTRQFWRGVQTAFSYLDTQPNMVFNDGKEYRIYVSAMENHNNATLMQEQYRLMVKDDSLPFLLGPINSDFGCLARPIVDPHKVTIMPIVAADSCSVDSERVFSTMPPVSKAYGSAMTSMKLQKAKRYSFIMEDQSAHRTACLGSIKLAAQSKIDLACNITIPLSLGAYTNASVEAWRAAIDTIADPTQCEQDFVIMCAYATSALVMLERAKELDYTPKQWLNNPFTGFGNNPLRWFVSGAALWSPLSAYSADPYFGTPSDYANSFEETYGYRPDAFDAGGTTGIMVWWNTLMTAKTLDPDQVLFALSRTDFSSFWGDLTFKGNHLSLLDQTLVQFVPDAPYNTTVAAPAAAQTAELIYPIPTWKERESDLGWFKDSDDIVVAALFALCTFLTLVMIVIVIMFRNRPVFRASQVTPSLIMMVGGIICFVSVFCWMNYVTDASCAALPWVLGTGFILLFGTLTLKTWRVWYIFSSSQDFRQAHVSEEMLALFLAALLSVFYVILIPWTIVSPLRAVLNQPQLYRPAYDYYSCYSDDESLGFLIAVLVYLGILLVAGAAFAFGIRNISYHLFNEAKVIGFAIYNLLICCAIGVGLIAGNVGGPDSVFWIHSILILFAPLFTLLLLFLPKMYLNFSSKADTLTLFSQHTSGSRTSSGTTSPSVHLSTVV